MYVMDVEERAAAAYAEQAAAAQRALDAKAKPVGSLGTLEAWAVTLCTAQRTLRHVHSTPGTAARVPARSRPSIHPTCTMGRRPNPNPDALPLTVTAPRWRRCGRRCRTSAMRMRPSSASGRLLLT